MSSMILFSDRGRSRGVNIPLVCANRMLFFACTTHFALEFNHFYIILSSIGVESFGAETNKLVGADILLGLIDFIGDIVLICRCWVIWGKNYSIIVLPLLSAVAGFACNIETMHLLIVTDPTAPEAPSALVLLGLAGIILPLCTNVMVTSLIAGRIWYISRGVFQISQSSFSRRAIILVIESGALYMVVQLIFVVLYAIKHPAQDILAASAVQVYGIAPTLIIIRVRLGMSFGQHTETNTTSSLRFPHVLSHKKQPTDTIGHVNSVINGTIVFQNEDSETELPVWGVPEMDRSTRLRVEGGERGSERS